MEVTMHTHTLGLYIIIDFVFYLVYIQHIYVIALYTTIYLVCILLYTFWYSAMSGMSTGAR